MSKVFDIFLKLNHLKSQSKQYSYANLIQFQEKYSSMEALVYLAKTIPAKTDEDEFVAAALLDLSKAFDSKIINF